MTFKVTYTLTDGSTGVGNVTGPRDATEADCERIVKHVASTYEIVPESVQVSSIPERKSHGFLHPLQHKLEDGRFATVTNWYF